MRVVVTGRLEQRSWETDEGEHRSKVELTADEIGPSLRFATADVHRTERRGAEAETQRGRDLLSRTRGRGSNPPAPSPRYRDDAGALHPLVTRHVGVLGSEESSR